MTIEVGTRVRVSLPERARTYWAVGAFESLNGKVGVVERVKTATWPISDDSVLVRFDEPAKPWWTSQTPPAAWHFRPSELIPEASSSGA